MVRITNKIENKKNRPRQHFEVEDTDYKILRLQHEQFLREQKALKNLNKKYGKETV